MKRSMIVFLLMLAATVLAALPAAAQGTPNPPSGITTTPTGDAEVTVSWTTPVSSEACDATDYFVRVYDPSGHSDTTEVFTAQTSHTVGGLNPGTAYVATVWTYSASCDDYSASPAKTMFTTADVSSEADPAPTATPLLAPRQPTNVQASSSGSTASVSWTAPVDDATHCDVTDYSVVLDNLTDSDADDIWDDYITSTSATVSVTSGHEYQVYVYAYSEDCDAWSPGGAATITN